MLQQIIEILWGGCKCEFKKDCEDIGCYLGGLLCTNSYKRDRINQTCYQTMLETQPAREAERNQVPGTA